MSGNFYSINTVKLVQKLYGPNSEVFQLMNNGEKISPLVKADIKKKGKNINQNFKAKKELLQLAKEEEEYKDLEERCVKSGIIN